MDSKRRESLKMLLAAGIGAATFALLLRVAHSRNVEEHSVSFIAAERITKAERAKHERYMEMAIEAIEGRSAPFGAVIVDRHTDKVVCRGGNKYKENPTLHAEMVVISACAKIRPRIDWRKLTLYTTAEPCPMCASAAAWARIPQIVYGTSIQELIEMNIHQIRLDSPTIAAAANFHSTRIVGGIMNNRTNALYREWAARFKLPD